MPLYIHPWLELFGYYFQRKENQARERDLKYQAIMRNLVRRYVTQVKLRSCFSWISVTYLISWFNMKAPWSVSLGAKKSREWRGYRGWRQWNQKWHFSFQIRDDRDNACLWHEHSKCHWSFRLIIFILSKSFKYI